jgi:hypothetical protein
MGAVVGLASLSANDDLSRSERVGLSINVTILCLWLVVCPVSMIARRGTLAPVGQPPVRGGQPPDPGNPGRGGPEDIFR